MLLSRRASPADAAAIAAIYNEGIEDRVATFETRPRAPEDILAWFSSDKPVVVVEAEGQVVGFAACSTYRDRECYAGIFEFSVYVARSGRGQGVGMAAMDALIRAAEGAGAWKLVSRIFPENTGSLALMRQMGFREVGRYERHGKLDGVWRDVIIVEKLLGA